MTPFPIAALQLELPRADNRDLLERETDSVVRMFPRTRMVVWPELAAFGPGVDRAESMPGPTEDRFRALARRHRIWLIPGSIYERAGVDVFNTAPVIDPDGEVVARYRKTYPFLPYEKGVTPGSEFVVFDVPGAGRFGISICYDMWFPETTRALVWKGAEVIIHPTLTGTIDRPLELVLAQANAIANQCYFVDVNAAGALGNGCSIISGPEGEIVHQSGATGEHIPFTIDFDRVRHVRKCGTLQLGQVLKSFRDSRVGYQCYRSAYAPSEALDALGALEIINGDAAGVRQD